MHTTDSPPAFDANIAVGDTRGTLSPLRDRAQLLAEMDRHGIGRALIYHANSHEPFVDGTVTDGELDEWRNERLFPQWTGLPTPISIERLQQRHAAGDLTCVRICAGERVYSPFNPWLYGELLTWLAEIGAPAVIELTELDPDDIVRTLKEFPRLRSILVGAHPTHAIFVPAMLRAVDGMHLELSRYEPLGGVEALCREFGSSRLLYGSWYPRYAMGTIVHYLRTIDLSDGDRVAVLGGTLEGLLGMTRGRVVTA